MKLEENQDGTKTIILSRRNLLSLLAKLDGHPPNSACTIGGGSDAEGYYIRAEEDDVHYTDRPAGEMHLETEEHTSRPATGTEPATSVELIIFIPPERFEI